MQHYIGPVVYPKGMPRRLELIAGVSVALWNAMLYLRIYWWLSRATATG